MKNSRLILGVLVLALAACKGEEKTADKPPAPVPAAAKADEPAKVEHPAMKLEDYLTGVPECDELAKKAIECQKLHGDKMAEALGTAVASKKLPPDLKAQAGEMCKEKAAKLQPELAAAGC